MEVIYNFSPENIENHWIFNEAICLHKRSSQHLQFDFANCIKCWGFCSGNANIYSSTQPGYFLLWHQWIVHKRMSFILWWKDENLGWDGKLQMTSFIHLSQFRTSRNEKHWNILNCTGMDALKPLNPLNILLLSWANFEWHNYYQSLHNNQTPFLQNSPCSQ